MKNNRDKKIYWGLAGAVAVLIVFAALTITYIQKFNRTLIEENEAHLSEIAGHITAYIHSVGKDTQGSLENAAGAVGILPQDQRLAYLEEDGGAPGFCVRRICFCGRTVTCYGADAGWRHLR